MHVDPRTLDGAVAAQAFTGVVTVDIADRRVLERCEGMAGIGLLALSRRRLQSRAPTVMTRVCAIGTALALLLIGVFVAVPLR